MFTNSEMFHNDDLAHYKLHGIKQYEAFKKALENHFKDQGIQVIHFTHMENERPIGRGNGTQAEFIRFKMDDVPAGHVVTLATTKDGNTELSEIVRINLAIDEATVTAPKHSPTFPVIKTLVTEVRDQFPESKRRDDEHAHYHLENSRQTAHFLQTLRKAGTYSIRHDKDQPDVWHVSSATSPQSNNQSNVAQLTVHGGHARVKLDRNYEGFKNLAAAVDEAKTAYPRLKGTLPPNWKTSKRDAPAAQQENVRFDAGQLEPAINNWHQNLLSDYPTRELTRYADGIRASIGPDMQGDEARHAKRIADHLDAQIRKRQGHIPVDNRHMLGFDELEAYLGKPQKRER